MDNAPCKKNKRNNMKNQDFGTDIEARELIRDCQAELVWVVD